MMILVPVPYLPGDPQDRTHVRVENHHREGLTYSHVRIDGWAGTRYVRSVSRPDRPKFPTSVLVHLKPMYSERPPTLHCRNLPTICILEYVQDNLQWPTVEDYNNLAAHYSAPSVTKRLEPNCRLIQRKQRQIMRKGLVENDGATVTAKGLKQLEQRRAGN
jgi:hypothetical protein